MATLSVQTIKLDDTGTVVTYANPNAGGDEFVNPANKRAFLRVKTQGTVTTFTVDNPKTLPAYVAAGAHDINITTGTNEIVEVGPFPEEFEDVNGKVQITYSEIAGVQVAVVTDG